MKTLYLDIDGVLLGKTQDGRTTLASGAEELITYALDNYDCYWLTTHCQGDVETVLSYLAPYCDAALLAKFKQIKPTCFTTFKTEAIDFSKDFIWLDDYLFNAEIKVLKENGCLSSWLQVNSYTDEDSLIKCLAELRKDTEEEA